VQKIAVSKCQALTIKANEEFILLTAALMGKDSSMKTIKAKIPDQLYRQLDTLVKQGWFRSHEDVIDEALRRFLNSHRPELMEKFIREDVERGLHGTS
jgi:Arc/MetJ-type ribon-helix-helix transcriptional regulator